MMKFKIHLSFIITSVIFLLSPYQLFYIKLLFAIIIHELGHIIIIKLFKLKIKSLTLYSFGFIMDIEYYKKTFIKELLIYIFGILFNVIFYLISDTFKEPNLTLILANLIPLYPLDGYHIINILLDGILPYKKAMYVSSIIGLISIIIIACFMIFNFDLLFLSTVIYLMYIWYIGYKRIPESYNNFLINRYTKKEQYKLMKIDIEKDVLDSFYKYRSIYCIYNNKRIDENELLTLKYNLN